ncbi:UNVERIFIED_ORG: hypothetical protein DFO82_1703 [Idiomarina abyssalis]|uniref:hypothetical protein n=1 Tax=unclassified Idiomarina TaxID=2614829 RepID=UPI000E0E5A08|nr:hypothetical protein [Idiomarina sp. 017G]TDO49528.1 hypothetical protein DEU30_105114 [Idiomarina sp. 017G]
MLFKKKLVASALDDADFKSFSKKYGRSLCKDLAEWVRLIVEEGVSEAGFKRLHNLAWYIFVERQGAHFGEKKRFTVDDKMVAYQELIYSLNVFETIGVPYKEWHPVVEALFDALRVSITKGDLDLQKEHFKAVQLMSQDFLGRISNDPVYQHQYTDYLNGAL